MKTQVIQLEPYDDAVSARDKMGWGQTNRILLVWPPRRRMMNRRLDLLLLQRHSRQLGAQLALVSRDGDVRHHAADLGIPVFKNVDEAQTERWLRTRRGRPPMVRRREGEGEALPDPRQTLEELKAAARPPPAAWRLHLGVRLGLFALGMLATLSLAAVLLPSARIHLTPNLQTQRATINVEASLGIQQVSPRGTLPARWVTVVVEGRDSLETTGTVEVPASSATGTVRFTNLTDQPVTIPTGAVVRTLENPPVRFVTTRSGSLMAGAGQAISLQVEAATRGSAGNLPAGSLRGVEGALGLQVEADNIFPTRGGVDIQAAAPNDRDRRRLYNRLLGSLQETATEELNALLEGDDFILSPAPELLEVQEEIYLPAEGEASATLELVLRVAFQAQVVDGQDLRALSNTLMDASLPVGFDPQPETLRLQPLTEPTFSPTGLARWQVWAERIIAPRLIDAQVIQLGLGLTPAAAAERISDSLPVKEPPAITVHPTWWPRLPVLPFRVRVDLMEG